MINHLKIIKYIGNFTSYIAGGSFPLSENNKISIIFGRNTLGKTTISSIFSSLGANEPSHILDRRTISTTKTGSPSVKIGYTDILGQRKTVDFKSGIWDKSDLEGRVYVFDQDFIYKHLITGTEVTRSNREHFTNFVLGKEGVQLSNEIEQLNKELRQLKVSLPNMRPPYAVKEQMTGKDVTAYAAAKYTDSVELLTGERENNEKSLRRLEKLEEFNKLKPFNSISANSLEMMEKTISDYIELLNRDYKHVTTSARNRLQAHIKQHTADEQNGLMWIKQGLKLRSGEVCPFCAQSTLTVSDLLDTYELVFNDEFEDFTKKISTGSIKIATAFDSFASPDLSSSLLVISQDIEKYEPYIDDLKSRVVTLRELAVKLEVTEKDIKSIIFGIKQELRNELQIKDSQPHLSIKSNIDFEQIRIKYQEADRLCLEANRIIEGITKVVKEARDQVSGYNAKQIMDTKAGISAKLKIIEMKIARLGEDNACQKYIEHEKRIAKYVEEIKSKGEQLENEQSGFLDQYFTELNKLFRDFGSRDFELIKETSNKGDKKTYFLSVRYKGQPIKPEQLCNVFSDSDKRSLALAIFFCKTSSVSNREKSVLVLDDPVVSFDDNRIGQSIRVIKDHSRHCAQVIILTHYSSLVAECYRQSTDANYLELVNTTQGTELKSLDIEVFSSTPHESDFLNISRFIDGDDSIDIRRKLRPFMEDHIKLVYAKQIHDLGIPTTIKFSSLIDELCSAGVISEPTKDKLHEFRESFNPDHHTSPVDPNPSATRVDVVNLFSFLYDSIALN